MRVIGGTGRKRRIAWVLLLSAVTTSLDAASLPRTTLWRVEQTCLLNHRATGLPFPCLEVDLTGGVERGFAVLRAPFRQTHVVTMPAVRISGIEDPRLRVPGSPNYFADAWAARRFVQTELKRPVTAGDFGLAVNSRLTRSQDQLHIHVDCVRASVMRVLEGDLPLFPADVWQAGGYVFHGQSYWVRRIRGSSLDGINPFALADEIPALRRDPSTTILAVIGTVDSSGAQNGFLLLAGRSDLARGDDQSTSEDLLDHSCGRPRR